MTGLLCLIKVNDFIGSLITLDVSFQKQDYEKSTFGLERPRGPRERERKFIEFL